MKTLYTALFFLLLCFQTFSQTSVDSLNKQLQSKNFNLRYLNLVNNLNKTSSLKLKSLNYLMHFYNAKIYYDLTYPFYEYIINESDSDFLEQSIFKLNLLHINYYNQIPEFFNNYNIDSLNLESNYYNALYELYKTDNVTNSYYYKLNPISKAFVEYTSISKQAEKAVKNSNYQHLNDILSNFLRLENIVNKHSKNILSKNLKLLRLKLLLYSGLSDLQKSINSYGKLKLYILEDYKKNLNISYENTYPYHGKAFATFFELKRKSDPKFVVNELIFWNSLHHVYSDKIFKPSFKDSLSSYHQEKSLLYHQIENKTADIYTYIDIAKLFLKENETVKPYLNQLDSVHYNLESVQSALKENETLLWVQKDYISNYLIQIEKNAYSFHELDLNPEFYQSLKNQSIVLIDPNKGISQFENAYLKAVGEIPTVRYLSNPTQLITAKKNEFELNSIALYGTDQGVNYQEKQLPQLYYIKEEVEFLNQQKYGFTFKNYFNQNKNAIDYTDDILHFSGHFISSEYHPLFNKVIIGKVDSLANTLKGFEVLNQPINSSLVILNGCFSGNAQNLDFKSQQHFGKFFLESGVKTVLITQNDIDDRTASLFIKEFYKHFLTGSSVTESLKNAKEYIRTHVNPNPDFWNAFQIYGSDLNIEKAYSKPIFGLVMCLFSIFLFIIFYKKRN